MNVTLTDEGYTLDGKWRLVPVEPTKESIRNMLCVKYPATYREYLRHPDSGPRTQASTESDICTATAEYHAAIKSAPNPPQSMSSIPPDCRACANRGRINGLSQESYCDGCIWQGMSFRQNHFVDASKMVDTAKRRCEACAILPCSCK